MKRKFKFKNKFLRKSIVLNLKNIILKKRYYISSNNVEKLDFLFDNYKNSIISKMIQLSELKRFSVSKILKKKYNRRKIFLKTIIRGIAKRIKNELLLMTPELLYLHKKAKSWRFIKNKKRKFRRLKNIKKMVLRYFPNYRESYILKEQLRKTYFWLVNTTKRQVMNSMKLNKLKITNNIFNNYMRLKNKFFKKKQNFLKKKNKFFIYYLNNKKKIFKKAFNLFVLKFNRIIIILSLKFSNYFLKFFLFKYINLFIFRFKKTILMKSLKDSFNISLTDITSIRKGKYKLRKRIRKKLKFFYKLYEKKRKIFKLKVRMVNSNFFITLTDYNDNVIIYKSTGQVSENRKKKVKLSPYLVTKMMAPILYRIKKNKIKLLFFFVNSKINRHINNVMKLLKTLRYTRILKVLFSKPVPHHLGTRKPKLRRL